MTVATNSATIGTSDSVMARVSPSNTLSEEVLDQIHKAAAQESSFLLGRPAGPHRLTFGAHAPVLSKVVFCRLIACHHTAANGSRAVCSLRAD